MNIKSLHFNWFWLYSLALGCIGLMIYWQYARHKKMMVYSPLNKWEIIGLEVFNRQIIEGGTEVSRIFDIPYNFKYLSKMILLDSLSKSDNPEFKTADQLIALMKTEIEPEDERIHKMLDSIALLNASPEIFDPVECAISSELQKAMGIHVFNLWCANHITGECWGGGIYPYYPETISKIPSKIKAGEKVQISAVLSGRASYDLKLNNQPYHLPKYDIEKLDTIFPESGIIPLRFDINVRAYKNYGKTHHTDTIYLEVSPAK